MVDHERREMRRRRGGKCEAPEPAVGCFLAALFVAFAFLALAHLALPVYMFLEMRFGISNYEITVLRNSQ